MLSSFPALVTVLALLLYIGVFVAAGRARGRYGVQAPAITGAPEFERALRVQQNTLEQLIWFLPALWLFAAYVSALWASIIGLVWIAGRIYYAVSYYRDPATREPGFIIGFASSGVLLIGALVGILIHLF